MTFSRATSGLGRGRQIPPSEVIPSNNSAKMPEMVAEDPKPEKFLSEAHEIQWELADCGRKVIIRITREDFIQEVEDYDP